MLADDVVVINSLDGGDRLFSRKLACVVCGISVPEMSPRAFSFNSPHGACPSCQGLGATWDFDPQRIVPDDSLSLAGGAIAPWGKGDSKLVSEAVDVDRVATTASIRRRRSASCRRSSAT